MESTVAFLFFIPFQRDLLYFVFLLEPFGDFYVSLYEG